MYCKKCFLEKMDITYKYQTSEKQAFGAPPPKKRQKYAPTNRISQGFANAIRAANTNGYIASANMMSYKSGADYVRHNQPLLNTRLLRLKNDPITLNESYYGKRIDPVEVRNFKFAKGPNAYRGNAGGMRFGMHHLRDQNTFVVPPVPAFAGPHPVHPPSAADIAAELEQTFGPRLDYMIQHHPDEIAEALYQKGFQAHPLLHTGGLGVNPLLPSTPSTPASRSGTSTPSTPRSLASHKTQGSGIGTPIPGVSPVQPLVISPASPVGSQQGSAPGSAKSSRRGSQSSPQGQPAQGQPASPQGQPNTNPGKTGSKYSTLIPGYDTMSKSQKKKASEAYRKQQSKQQLDLLSPSKTRSGAVRNLNYPSPQDLSLLNQVQNPDQRQDLTQDFEEIGDWWQYGS